MTTEEFGIVCKYGAWCVFFLCLTVMYVSNQLCNRKK